MKFIFLNNFYIFQFSKLNPKKYYTNVGLDNDDMLCSVVVVEVIIYLYTYVWYIEYI